MFQIARHEKNSFINIATKQNSASLPQPSQSRLHVHVAGLAKCVWTGARYRRTPLLGPPKDVPAGAVPRNPFTIRGPATWNTQLMTERQHQDSHHHGTCNMQHTAYDRTATPGLSPPRDLQHGTHSLWRNGNTRTLTTTGPATCNKQLMTERQQRNSHHQGTCSIQNCLWRNSNTATRSPSGDLLHGKHCLWRTWHRNRAVMRRGQNINSCDADGMATLEQGRNYKAAETESRGNGGTATPV